MLQPRTVTRVQDLAFFTAAASGSAALCLLGCRHLLPNIGTQLIGTHNDVVYSFDTLSWHWRMLAELRLTSILDAPIMAPLPHGHAYGDNLFALALLGAPIAALGGEVLAYNVLLLSTFVLCAVFGAGFGRALTGSRLAGLIVGLTFAFVPIRVEKIHELNNLASMWVPLSAWALVRWYRSPSWRWLAIGFLAVYAQFLSSIQLFIYLVLFLGVWLLWLWARSIFTVRLRVVLQVLALVAVAVPLFLPWALVYGRVRAFLPGERSTDEIRAYTPPIEAWLDRLWPGDVVVLLFSIAVLMVLLARFSRARRLLHLPGHPHVAPLVGVALMGPVLAQGPWVVLLERTWVLPFFWLGRIYPLLNTIRAPERAQMVATAFACGAGGIALAWLMAGVRRLVSRHPHSSPRWAAAGSALPLSLVVLVAVQAPAITTNGRELRLPEVAEALRRLPKDAVVFPVPFFANHPRRPPVDHLAVASGVRMVGGYGGAIPDLFWSLRHRAGEFPEERSLESMRATGATHVLVHLPSLSPPQWSATEQLESEGALRRLFAGDTWQLAELAVSSPLRELEPFEWPATEFELRGPSVVAAEQRVTLALVPRLDRVYIDPVVQRPVTVEIVAAVGGWLVDSQRAALRSPQVVEPDGFPYQVCLDGPARPGHYLVRVLWPPCPPCRDHNLTFPLEVRERLETSAVRPVRRAAIALLEPAHGNRRQVIRLDMALGNEDAHVWLARSNEKLLANRGQIILHTTFNGPAPTQQSHLPWRGHPLLPHDLGPGDRATTRVYVDAPPQPGDYSLTVAAGPHHVPDGACVPVWVGEAKVD